MSPPQLTGPPGLGEALRASGVQVPDGAVLVASSPILLDAVVEVCRTLGYPTPPALGELAGQLELPTD